MLAPSSRDLYASSIATIFVACYGQNSCTLQRRQVAYPLKEVVDLLNQHALANHQPEPPDRLAQGGVYEVGLQSRSCAHWVWLTNWGGTIGCRAGNWRMCLPIVVTSLKNRGDTPPLLHVYRFQAYGDISYFGQWPEEAFGYPLECTRWSVKGLEQFFSAQEDIAHFWCCRLSWLVGQ